MFKPERCIKVIVATAILHRLCIKNAIPLQDDLPDEAMQEEHEDQEGEIAGDGFVLRNQIIEYHFTH